MSRFSFYKGQSRYSAYFIKNNDTGDIFSYRVCKDGVEFKKSDVILSPMAVRQLDESQGILNKTDMIRRIKAYYGEDDTEDIENNEGLIMTNKENDFEDKKSDWIKFERIDKPGIIVLNKNNILYFENSDKENVSIITYWKGITEMYVSVKNTVDEIMEMLK